MNRRAFFGTSAALTLGAGAPAAQAQAGAPIVIAPLSGPDAATIYYSQQQGWLRDAGLDPTITPIANGPAGMSGMIGGSINVAEGNILSLCEAHAKGVPITLVAPGPLFDVNAAQSVRLVATVASGAHGPRDLSGKTVAVPSLGDLLTISTRGLIDQAGADSTKVHFVEMPPGAMVGALQAQRIDAAALYDPFLSSAIAQGALPIGIPYSSIAPTFLIVAWFAYAPWAGTHRSTVNAFTGVLGRSTTYVNAHYHDLIPMISSFSHIPPEALANMAFAPIAPKLDPAIIQPVINMAAKYNAIPRAFPAKELLFSANA